MFHFKIYPLSLCNDNMKLMSFNLDTTNFFSVFSALKEESHLEQVSPASWHSTKSSHILGDSTNHVIIDVNKMKPSVEETYGVAMKSLADDRKLANRPDCVEVSFCRFYIFFVNFLLN